MAADSASKTPTPRVLTVEDILQSADTPTDTVFIKEWGGGGLIEVRGLTKRQQVDIRRASMVAGEVDPELTQRGLWLEGVVNPKFTEDQLGLLFEKQAGAVDRVLTRILELSGMSEDAAKEKEKTFRS